MRRTLTLTVHAALAAALTAQTWQTPNLTATPPSQRRSGAMAYDAINSRLVLFGGLTQTPSTILDQTWTFNGQWTLLSNAVVGNPPGRWGHTLVQNTTNNTLLMFGGRSPTISALANDTYRWSGSAWTLVPTPAAPQARFLHGMAYDRARGVFVLFGGRRAQLSQQLTDNDTWEFDGTTWTERVLPQSPPPREEMGMVYDASTNRVVLFGGYDRDSMTLYGDTWTYDGTTWTQVTTANSPSPRYRGAMVYDTRRVRPIWYGGFDGTTISTETWQFTGDDWSLLNVVGPANATEMYYGFDPVRTVNFGAQASRPGLMVVFGGFDGSFTNATSQLGFLTTPGLFSLYGSGCQSVNGEPTLAATNAPTINTALTLEVGNMPLDCELALMALGVSNTTWQGLPLPLDLTPIGLSGCNLIAAAEFIDLTPSVNGVASYSVNIPNNAGLVGSSLFVQSILLDLLPGGGFEFIGATRGGRAVVGG
jgi:hypothetical protein